MELVKWRDKDSYIVLFLFPCRYSWAKPSADILGSNSLLEDIVLFGFFFSDFSSKFLKCVC